MVKGRSKGYKYCYGLPRVTAISMISYLSAALLLLVVVFRHRLPVLPETQCLELSLALIERLFAALANNTNTYV